MGAAVHNRQRKLRSECMGNLVLLYMSKLYKQFSEALLCLLLKDQGVMQLLPVNKFPLQQGFPKFQP